MFFVAFLSYVGVLFQKCFSLISLVFLVVCVSLCFLVNETFSFMCLVLFVSLGLLDQNKISSVFQNSLCVCVSLGAGNRQWQLSRM